MLFTAAYIFGTICGGRRTLVHSAALLEQFRLSVRDKSEHCENDERYVYGYYGEEAYKKSSPGYSGYPSLIDIMTIPFPNWRFTTPNQNLKCKLQLNSARYNGGLY